MVPYSRNERFIADNQKSDGISEKLAEQKLSHHRRLAIYGLGGVGYCNLMGRKCSGPYADPGHPRTEAKGLADSVQQNSRRTGVRLYAQRFAGLGLLGPCRKQGEI